MSEWLAVEAIIRQKDKEKTAMAVAKLSSGSGSVDKSKDPNNFEMEDDDDEDYLMENDVFEDNDSSDNKMETSDKNVEVGDSLPKKPNKSSTDSGNVPDDTEDQVLETEDVIEDEAVGGNNILLNSKATTPSTPSSYQTVENDYFDYFIDGTTSCPATDKFASIEDIPMKIAGQDEDNVDQEDDEDVSLQQTSVIVTNASIDITNFDKETTNGEGGNTKNDMSPVQEECNSGLDALQEPKSACVSPASSNGGVYSVRFSYVFFNFLFFFWNIY